MSDFEQLMRNREAPLQGNRGAGLAGMFLAGGNNPRAAQFQAQGQLEGARASDAMAQARQRQQQEVARANLSQSYRDKGQPDLADMVSGGINPNEYAEAGLNNQKTSQLKQAFDLAAKTGTSPDLNQLNRMLMVIGGKPETLSKVEGNVTLNPMVTPDQNKFDPTQLGLADIAQKKAQATEEYAGAGQHTAAADLDRARTGEVTEGRKTGKPLTAEEVKGSFGVPDRFGVMQTDPKQFEDFLYFQKKNAGNDPKYLDSHYALMQYKGGQASRAAGLADMAATDSEAAPTASTNVSAPATPPEAERGAPGLDTLFAGAPTPSGAGQAPAKGGKVGDSPHPEGTKLKGPDGKIYVVKNGQPVLAQ